jgi:hypothetical protein
MALSAMPPPTPRASAFFLKATHNPSQTVPHPSFQENSNKKNKTCRVVQLRLVEHREELQGQLALAPTPRTSASGTRGQRGS